MKLTKIFMFSEFQNLKKSRLTPWRRGAVDIASATWTDDPPGLLLVLFWLQNYLTNIVAGILVAVIVETCGPEAADNSSRARPDSKWWND
jgi:hypothetical protein